VAKTVVVAIPRFERVEGCVDSVARAAVLVVPVAEKAGFLLRVDAQEFQAQAQVPILAFIGVVDLREATTHTVRILVHAAAGDDLHRPMQVLAEVREVLGLAAVVTRAVAMQKLPDLPWNQHSVGIRFESPIVLSEAAVSEYLIPSLDKDATVQRGVILPPKRCEQIGINDGNANPVSQSAEYFLG
jgi:hypothetical protein